MVLDIYAHHMSDQRYYFCYTVLELVKRGYSGREARAMVKTSPLTQQINGPDSWAYLHDMGRRDWADMVEKCHHLARRGKLVTHNAICSPSREPTLEFFLMLLHLLPGVIKPCSDRPFGSLYSNQMASASCNCQ